MYRSIIVQLKIMYISIIVQLKIKGGVLAFVGYSRPQTLKVMQSFFLSILGQDQRVQMPSSIALYKEETGTVIVYVHTIFNIQSKWCACSSYR